MEKLEKNKIIECLALLQDKDLLIGEARKIAKDCDKILLDKKTLQILEEENIALEAEKNSLDKYITEAITENLTIRRQREEKSGKAEQLDIELAELNKKKDLLKDYKQEESKKLTEKISDVEAKIKTINGDLYYKQESKQKLDTKIKNEEDNVTYWQTEYNNANHAVWQAQTALDSAKTRGTYNTCWGGYSPELSNSCVNRFKSTLTNKKNIRNSDSNNLNAAKESLSSSKNKVQLLAKEIDSLKNRKAEETDLHATLLNERQELEKLILSSQTEEQKLANDMQQKTIDIEKINLELTNLKLELDLSSETEELNHLNAKLNDVYAIEEEVQAYIDQHKQEIDDVDHMLEL